MFTLNCKVIIGRFTFESVNEVSIESSWKNFTSTCTIKLPRSIYTKAPYFSEVKLDDYIKRGDTVTVLLGYNNNYNTEFEGYVTGVLPTKPVVIKCDDLMFKLKQTPVKPKNIRNASVKNVFDYILTGTGINYHIVGDIQLGDYHITAQYDTAAKVLGLLKDQYPILPSFFRDGILICGDAYNTNTANHVKLAPGKNIISSTLEYVRADDRPLKIVLKSKNGKGKAITYTTGSATGAVRTFNYINKTESQLKDLGEKFLKALHYDGFKGSITLFGEPVIRHGDVVQLTESERAEWDGNYFVDEVKKTYGQGGYRQVVTIGPKA